jgi:hypothetical protein
MIKFKQYLEPQATNWVRPSLEEEDEEIVRTAQIFKIDSNILRERFKKAKLVSLTDQMWKQMKNTDSYKTISMPQALKLAKSYNRDVDQIVKGFNNNEQIPVPLVAILNNEPYLVGGNTRLMVARAMKIKPMILLAN